MIFKPTKITIAVLCCFTMVFSCKKEQKANMLLTSGISLELANYRTKQISDVVYRLNFQIPKAKHDPIPAQLNLSLNILDLRQPLYLDFNADKSLLKKVEANGNDISVHHEQEHLVITPKYLRAGKNTIKITFQAGEQSLNRNNDYLYTLLVPDRASTLFPCFDQPNIKAKYILNITAPNDWEVLCAAPLETEEKQGDFKNYQFKTSDLMSTYLFSFVAGKFNTVQQSGNLNMKMLYRETDTAKIYASTEATFKHHDESVRFLEDYTQYKFPFQKLDMAAIPDFQYGGMEHVGAVQYRESQLFLDAHATQKQALRRCKLIAHETAHMWFGDLVTMNWFDDVWLKEVFANFLADKISAPIFPEVNHALNFMAEHYPSAYSEDRTQGATPIKQPLDNLKNAGTLYGRIVYNKSPIMMRQLEALLGEEAFKNGMRNYIKTYANANADWNDLIALLNAETQHDLKQWSKVWVNQSGRPVITNKAVYENGNIKQFTITQHAEDGSSKIWPQQFSIGLVYADSVKIVPVNITGKETILNALEGLKQPKNIIYNYNAFGYGIFPLGEIEAKQIPKIQDNVARGYSYINLYENVLTGNITPNLALNVLTEGVSTENNEIILNTIISYANSLFWKYIKEEERNTLGTVLEQALQKRLKSKAPPSLKKTLFGLYENIAYSTSGLDVLYGIWNKSITIKNLNLTETNYTDLACKLAVYNHPETNNILKEALNNINNPDSKKRLEFLLPSLSNTETIRANFVKSLSKPENREKESWVATALNYVHHPLRQQTSQHYLKNNLELVEEIQQTGDIFFPKAWLNATVGNYTTDYAYLAVETFLAEHPHFSPNLKNKLLQAADGVYRAKHIREQ
ncbi:MAG: M1 family metallopeptidase [Flavobacteriaceae bacterium]